MHGFQWTGGVQLDKISKRILIGRWIADDIVGLKLFDLYKNQPVSGDGSLGVSNTNLCASHSKQIDG